MDIVTLPERKSREAERRWSCADRAVLRLSVYARSEGGRFWVFGSYVTGRMQYDSDLDVLVDFPASMTAAAWRFAERLAAELDLPIDLHDARTTKRDFVDRVKGQGRRLS